MPYLWDLQVNSFMQTLRQTELKMFSHFVIKICLIAATALVEGKLGKSLKKVLKKIVAKEAHEQLAISDVKLGGVIKVSDAMVLYILYVSLCVHTVAMNNTTNWYWFSGKARPELYSQSNSV